MRLIRDNSGKAPMAVIVAAVLVLCLAAGGFAVVKLKKPGKHGKADDHKGELKQWKFEEFLVNLADKEENRYLKVLLVLEVAGEVPTSGGHGEEGGGVAEIKARDVIIGVLTKRTYRSLLSEEGKTDLKDELKKELNSALDDIKVEGIYFTSFAMQ